MTSPRDHAARLGALAEAASQAVRDACLMHVDPVVVLSLLEAAEGLASALESTYRLLQQFEHPPPQETCPFCPAIGEAAAALRAWKGSDA